MSDSQHVWALVLAAGEGRRLSRFTTTRNGISIPKQFCSLERGPSLLQEALQRAATVVAPERICAIVAAQHRRWWLEQLGSVHCENVFVQPQNRGTAIGILLPLLSILERDPQGRLGYIIPQRKAGQVHHEVARFIEKPGAALAQELLEQGALWNSFIIAADGLALLKLFERRCPGIVAAMRDAMASDERTVGPEEALADLYEMLPELDFSRSILQGQEQYLRVLPVPECGWSDLGTPQRLAEALHALTRLEPRVTRQDAGRGMFLSLAVQHRRLGSTGQSQDVFRSA